MFLLINRGMSDIRIGVIDLEYINIAIGGNIRKLRMARSMTLGDLAEISGVSKSMLGQIERGDANPTISTIWKIANGLKVSFSSMISLINENHDVIDKHDVAIMRSDDGLLENIPFFPFSAGRNFEMFEIILQPNGYLDGDNHPPKTKEFIIVFSGTLIIENDGQTHIIRPDQAYQFIADVPHRYSNIGSEETKFALVLFYPEI